MLKKLVLVALTLLLAGSVGLFFWARAVFSGENVRLQLGAQLAKQLGQPVRIGSVSAGIYPRVTVDLRDVTIGEPARIALREVRLGTALRALLSRRIEHATVRVDGARVELPLPPLFAEDTATSPGDPVGGAPAVALVSVDEVLLRDVEVVSGGRTLRAEVDAVPKGAGVILRRVTLAADDVAMQASGEITSLAGPVGTLAMKAEQLDLDRLLAFLGDFSTGVGTSTHSTAQPGGGAAGSSPDLTIALATERAIAGGLQLDSLGGTVRVTGNGVSIDPIGFGVFGGRYDGNLTLETTSSAPSFRAQAQVKDVDVAALTEFAGKPGTLSGRLSGRVDLAGSGGDLATAVQALRGRARLDLANGAVPRLNLVRTIIVATSGRSDVSSPGAPASQSGERFERIGATLEIVNGVARSDDLRFESPDVLVSASGTLAMSGSVVDLAGRVQLSEALTQQSGRDLVRYTAEDGRVTLPATITGSIDQLRVRVNVMDLAKRAIRNRAKEELDSAIQRGLGGLFKKRPPK